MTVPEKRREGGGGGGVGAVRDATAFDDDDDFPLPAIDGVAFVDYEDESRLDDVMRLVGRDLSEPYSIFTYRYFLHRWPQLCILAVPTDAEEDEEGEGSDARPIGCVVCKIDAGDGGPTDVAAADEAAAAAIGEAEKEAADAWNDVSCNDRADGANVRAEQIANGEPPPPDAEKVLTGYIGMLAVDTSRRRSGIGLALVTRAIRRMQLMGCTSIRLETEVSNVAAMKLYEDRLGFVREELLRRYYLNWGDAYRLRLWLED
ncbi:hypothetical protein ACHAWF_002744 [Thalassiosira exigua]